MALEKEKRLLLQKFVSAGRKLLSTEYSRVLEGVYGLNEVSGQVEDIDSLTFSSDQEYEAAKVLRARFVLYGDSVSNNKEVVNRLVRELSFTTLNRFVALKIFEKRGIILESVSKGYNSKGFQLYKRVCDTSLGESYFAFKSYLMSLFDELTDDLNTVFDRYSEFGVLFPREAILNELLELINDEHLEDIWNNDEALGWIYQYFNLDSERKKMRDQSKNPRSSRELAVRNQFFTPRYVVESLVDNTLAKYWVEFNSGNSELKSFCKYLLLDESEPVKNKVKDPRELKVLDPACGSMHFGLYVFDLLEKIYEEAWELELTHGLDYFERKESGKSLTQSFINREEFYRHIPKLIVENNINGVDIDPRAAQIAQLAIWLRAQKSWNDRAVTYADRPKILKNFIVTAESFSNSEKLLERFESTLDDIKPTYKKIKDELSLANMLGSLVRFDAIEDDSLKTAIIHLKSKIEVFEKPEEISFLEFHNFKDSMNKALKFLSVLAIKYDAILMNPPFGEAAKPTLSYLKSHYNEWNKNILCCFFEKTYDMLTEVGSVGAIYDRTALVKSTYENFRRTHIIPNNRIEVLIDLGWDVLDANVEVTSIVLSRRSRRGFFLDLRKNREKENQLLSMMDKDRKILRLSSEVFSKFPNSVIGYDFPDFVIRAFREMNSLEEVGFIACQGNAIKSDQHHRNWWEVVKGDNFFHSRCFNGAGFEPYFTSLINSITSPVNPFELPASSTTRLGNRSVHWKPRVAFGKRGEYLSAHLIKEQAMYTVEGQAFQVDNEREKILLTCFLNTPVIRYILNLFCGQHKYSGYVNLIPYCSFLNEDLVLEMFTKLMNLRSELEKWDYLLPCFNPSFSAHESFEALTLYLKEKVLLYQRMCNELEEFCNSDLLKAFGVSEEEQKIIVEIFNSQPEPKLPIIDFDLDKVELYVSHMITHYCFVKSFESEKSEILLNYGSKFNMFILIRREMDKLFEGSENVEELICYYLTVSNIEEYFNNQRSFFKNHLRVFTKNRRVSPLFWPLTYGDGDYVFWLYFPNLQRNSIYSLINNFVSPFVLDTKKNLEQLKRDNNSRELAILEEELEQLSDFEMELNRIASKWDVGVLDGIYITAAQLRNCFSQGPWKDTLDSIWDKIESGEFDWSKVALSYFPERVRAKMREGEKTIKVFQKMNIEGLDERF